MRKYVQNILLLFISFLLISCKIKDEKLILYWEIGYNNEIEIDTLLADSYQYIGGNVYKKNIYCIDSFLIKNKYPPIKRDSIILFRGYKIMKVNESKLIIKDKEQKTYKYYISLSNGAQISIIYADDYGTIYRFVEEGPRYFLSRVIKISNNDVISNINIRNDILKIFDDTILFPKIPMPLKFENDTTLEKF